MRDEDERRLPAEQEDAVGVGCDRQQRREDPERPASAAAALERLQQCERAGERAEEKEAVHAAVDPVEQEQPAGREERRRDERDARSGEAPAEQGDERQAPEREHRGGDAQAAESEPEVCDGPRDEEVQRCAAAVPRDVLDDAWEGVSADEQCKRLVLVRRPRHELVEEERRRGGGHSSDPQPEPALGDPGARRGPCGGRRCGLDACLDPLRHGVSAASAGRLAVRCRSTNTVARTGTRSRCSSG